MTKGKEGILTHDAVSPTAATVGNRLFEDSGPMKYRVMVATGMGFIPFDVVAKTGDDAAAAALAKYPGTKVASVNPAPAGETAEAVEAEAA